MLVFKLIKSFNQLSQKLVKSAKFEIFKTITIYNIIISIIVLLK